MMTNLERLVVRTWGHSFDALGLLTIPTLIFTLMIAALVFVIPGKEVFFGGVWFACGTLQAIGVMAARKIRIKHNCFDR